MLNQNSSTDLTVFDRLVSHRPRTIGGIHHPEIGWMDNAVVSWRYCRPINPWHGSGHLLFETRALAQLDLLDITYFPLSGYA